ncbi:MAG: D-alanyl-alanine synthetase [Alphaproteobacteria bacterium]|nr:D-alanyl-alanine synthetase [Alphaproteobacteria bacterium]
MLDKTLKTKYSANQVVFGDPTEEPEPNTVRPPRRSGRLEELESQVARLLGRMNIAVIYGGDKTVEGAVINRTQNPRSWKSYEGVARDIADSLRRLGCKSVHLMPDDMRLGERLRTYDIHMGWLNTGGVQGYDSMLHGAALLEMAGIPYVGHNPLTAGILDNKHTFKRQLNAFGISTATFMTWHLSRGPFCAQTNVRFKQCFEGYTGPFIVKPVCGRASQNIAVIDDASELMDAVDAVYRATENHVLIEEFLPGREFTAAVCGQTIARERRLARSTRPFVFSVVERVLAPEERIFTSMDVSPITMNRLRLLGPDSDIDTFKKIVDAARTIFEELDIDTLIRLDLRMDANGDLNILEVNPKPDIKKPSGDTTSIVCAGLQACGMDYDDLILSLFADRIDRLLCERRHIVTSFNSLLD